MTVTSADRTVRVADAAGALGAIFAAPCCAGTPIIAGTLAALGLSFLRSDSIRWPLMLVSLFVALWGSWRGWQMHESLGPLLVGPCGAAKLTAGVIIVDGFPAKELIGLGAVSLVGATLWTSRPGGGASPLGPRHDTARIRAPYAVRWPRRRCR